MGTLTPAEKNFLSHYGYELLNHEYDGPVLTWTQKNRVTALDMEHILAHYQALPDSSWEERPETGPDFPWPNREAVLDRNREFKEAMHQLGYSRRG